LGFDGTTALGMHDVHDLVACFVNEEGQIDRQTDRETERQTDRQTDRQV
jgi:hypothetical protein